MLAWQHVFGDSDFPSSLLHSLKFHANISSTWTSSKIALALTQTGDMSSIALPTLLNRKLYSQSLSGTLKPVLRDHSSETTKKILQINPTKFAPNTGRLLCKIPRNSMGRLSRQFALILKRGWNLKACVTAGPNGECA